MKILLSSRVLLIAVLSVISLHVSVLQAADYALNTNSKESRQNNDRFVFSNDKEIPRLCDEFKDYFLIGTAVNRHRISKDNPLVKNQFNSITAENAFKWEKIHPEPNEYNFDITDNFVEYAEKNGMALIGHTLVWHNQTPKWVFEDEDGNPASSEILLNRLREHIHNVVGRYKGKIKGWDVVNEALDEDGTLRQTPWLKIIGEDYIEKAFTFAHEADPSVELYYNDYSMENKPKRDGAVKLIKKLQAKGIEVHAVGLQGHYKMDWPSNTQLNTTIKAFAELGVKVMVTELDIDVLPYKPGEVSAEITMNREMKEKMNPYKDGLPDSVQQALAERYAGLFRVFLDNSNTVSRITFWGVTDKDSWLNNWPIRGRKSYPLLFDRNGVPKPAFYAVLKELSNK